MAARPDQSRTPTGFALGRVGFIWLGVLVGPMLVASGVVGAVWGLAAGLIAGVVFLALLLGAAYLARRPPEAATPLPESGPVPLPAAGGGSRLLVAAGEAAASADDVPAGIRALVGSAEEILVIAPVLPGRLDWLTSATDRARKEADERLRSVLGHLDELGADARGEVATDEPIEAFEDAVRRFGPDHILVALRANDRKGWQENGLLDQVQQRLGLPTTVFQLPD